MKYVIKYSCISHVGMCRSKNQDNYICDGQYKDIEVLSMNKSLIGETVSDKPSLFGVFDGMGGEDCGEVAALIAAQSAAETELNKKSMEVLIEYCKNANQQICQYADANDIDSMGTTAAMLVFSGKSVVLCNIGDSKVFLISNDEMEQISHDHVIGVSYYIKPLLSQNLGIPPEEMIIEPYVAVGENNIGDRYLICSDGLTDMLKEDEIQDIIEHTSFENCVDKLLQRALLHGGKDNITIILLEVEKDKTDVLENPFIFLRKKGRNGETSICK